MQDEREFMEQYSSEEGDEIFDDTEPGDPSPLNHIPDSPGSDSPISDNRSADDLTTPNSKGSPKAGKIAVAAWLLVWVVAASEQAVDERCTGGVSTVAFQWLLEFHTLLP